MQRQTGKKSGVGSVSMALLVLLIIISLVPLIGQRIGTLPVLIISFAYFFSIITPLYNLDRRLLGVIVPAILYISYEGLYIVLGISTGATGSLLRSITTFLCLLYILPIYDRITEKQKKTIVTAIIVSIFFTIAHNFYLYLQWGASNYIILFRGDLGEEGKMGAMNTQYISALLFFSGACLCCFYRERNRLKKTIYLALVVLCLYFMIAVAQRGIMLILAIILLPLLHLYRKVNRSKREFLVMIVVVLLAVVAVIRADAILLFLQNHISSSRLQSRIYQMRVFFSNGLSIDSSGSLFVRLGLIETSWSTFTASFSNFLFGVGYHAGTDQLIGNHSRIIDNLARYGIVGNLFFYLAVRGCYRGALLMTGTRKGSALSRQFHILMAFVVARAFLGEVVTSTYGMILFLFIPILFSRYQEDTERQLGTA